MNDAQRTAIEGLKRVIELAEAGKIVIDHTAYDNPYIDVSTFERPYRIPRGEMTLTVHYFEQK